MSIAQFYVIALSFLGGVFVASFSAFSLPVITWLAFIGFVLILLWQHRNSDTTAKYHLWAGLFLVAFALGLLRIEVASWQFGNSVLEQSLEKKLTLTGIVTKEPDVREKSTMLEVQTDAGKVLVSTERYQPVLYGDKVEVVGTLTKPKSFETDLGRTFNYPGYLKAKGVEYKIAFAKVQVLESNLANPVLTRLYQFKRTFMQAIESSLVEPAAGLGEGLLLGVKQAIGEELEVAFRRTGIIHIVVLSGYNIMLVVIFVMFVLGQFFSRTPKMIMGIIAITTFALLVGLSATVVRASIMASILLVAQATGRVYLMLRALVLAGLIMILLNPFLLVYDVGFQLSFLATLGLILLAPHFELLLTKVKNLWSLRTFFIATLATQIAVLPLLLYQMGEFSVVSVLVNVLVLPMVPVAMLLTFLTGVITLILHPLAFVVAFPTYWSLRYITDIAAFFSELPFAAFSIAAFPFYLVLLAYGVLGFLLWRFNRSDLPVGYSEIGEGLLVKNQPTKTLAAEVKDEWVIEEEFDESEANRKGVAKVATPSVDIPIFFR